MFLNPTELYELTGKKRRQAQVAVLRQLGIEHKERADGAVLVLQSHVEKIFDGHTGSAVVKLAEPNWSALNAPA